MQLDPYELLGVPRGADDRAIEWARSGLDELLELGEHDRDRAPYARAMRQEVDRSAARLHDPEQRRSIDDAPPAAAGSPHLYRLFAFRPVPSPPDAPLPAALQPTADGWLWRAEVLRGPLLLVATSCAVFAVFLYLVVQEFSGVLRVIATLVALLPASFTVREFARLFRLGTFAWRSIEFRTHAPQPEIVLTAGPLRRTVPLQEVDAIAVRHAMLQDPWGRCDTFLWIHRRGARRWITSARGAFAPSLAAELRQLLPHVSVTHGPILPSGTDSASPT